MKKILMIISGILLVLTSCDKDFLETQPSNKIPSNEVFKSLDGAQGVVDGILRQMRVTWGGTHDQFGVKAIDLATDLMQGDIIVYKLHWFKWDYLLDNNAPTYRRPRFIWSLYYNLINNANIVLANIDGIYVTEEQEGTKAFIKAETLTLRAYSYFMLAQYFQNTYIGHENDPGVPIYTEPTTEGKPRATLKNVYDLILKDLDQAISLFSSTDYDDDDYSTPNLNLSMAIKANVALVMNDWDEAAKMANSARKGYSLNTVGQYSSGFSDGNLMVWMWGLPVNDEQSGIYASFFSHMDPTIGGYAGLGYSMKSMSFKGEHALYPKIQEGDIRKSLLVMGEKPKYLKFASTKGFSADNVMMRPEEMLLVEAEALANKGEIDGARSLLQELWNNRFKGDVPEVEFLDKKDALEKIYLERRIELWGEGKGLLDIKRLKKPIFRSDGGHDYGNSDYPAESPAFTYVIPQKEIENNPNISEADQNPM